MINNEKARLGYLAWCGLLAISISVTGWREGHEAFWFDDLEPPENQQQDQSTEEHGLTCDALTSTRSIWIVPNLGSRNLNSRDLRWHQPSRTQTCHQIASPRNVTTMLPSRPHLCHDMPWLSCWLQAIPKKDAQLGSSSHVWGSKGLKRHIYAKPDWSLNFKSWQGFDIIWGMRIKMAEPSRAVANGCAWRPSRQWAPSRQKTPCSDCNVMWKFSRQIGGVVADEQLNQPGMMVYMMMWNRVIYDSWCTQPKWYKYCSKAVADTFWCWCSHPNNGTKQTMLACWSGHFL